MINKITLGRTLDRNGDPIEDTGIELQADGPAAMVLKDSIVPLITNPLTGEYMAVLVDADKNGGELAKALIIMPRKAYGPPEHYHPNYTEEFEVVEGEFVFVLQGNNITLKSGERITVKPGEVHTFHTSGAYDVNACIGLARPASRIKGVVFTLFGMAHEGKLSKMGAPPFWQAMAMAYEFGDDTVFTNPPPAVQKAMAAVFGPLARLLGYRAIHPEKMEDNYWVEKVEQVVKTS
jgi:quercetin dioxygenase-like cupin family protein